MNQRAFHRKRFQNVIYRNLHPVILCQVNENHMQITLCVEKLWPMSSYCFPSRLLCAEQVALLWWKAVVGWSQRQREKRNKVVYLIRSVSGWQRSMSAWWENSGSGNVAWLSEQLKVLHEGPALSLNSQQRELVVVLLDTVGEEGDPRDFKLITKAASLLATYPLVLILAQVRALDSCAIGRGWLVP